MIYRQLFRQHDAAAVVAAEAHEQRGDDREDVVATRLKTYRAQTAPLIGYYTARGLLRSVDATVGADRVAEEVMRIVDSLSAAG